MQCKSIKIDSVEICSTATVIINGVKGTSCKLQRIYDEQQANEYGIKKDGLIYSDYTVNELNR
jgi:hypothetical protein